MIFAICPSLNEWTMWTPDLTLAISRHPDALPSMVTMLELYWSGKVVLLQSCGSLCDSLCSPPHVLHLREPRVRYFIDNIDFFRRTHDHLTPKNNYWTLPNVWYCRRLETFHLRFESCRQQLTGTPAIFLRILFGYIARVLPLLRAFQSDILVDNTYGRQQTIDLCSGFRLLARLKYLERLDLGGRKYYVDPCQMRWLNRVKSIPQDREARKRLVETWGDITKLELLGYGANRDYHTFRDDIRRMGHVIAGMVEELAFIGCLLDVARIVKAMDTDEFKCCPITQETLGFIV